MNCPYHIRTIKYGISQFIEPVEDGLFYGRFGYIIDMYYLVFLMVFYTKLQYNLIMSKKSIKETNPYLKDPKKYEAALITNVVTSSAVESIRITPEQLLKKTLKTQRA